MRGIGTNWILSLLVLVLAGVIGIALPRLQASPARPTDDAAWLPPSPTASEATSAPTYATSTATPAAVEIIDAPAGAVLAWQEPAPATPSSVPVLLSTPLATPSPVAQTPAPTWTATERPPNRAVLALAAPTKAAPTSTPAPEPVVPSGPQPAPPARSPSTGAAASGAASPTPVAPTRAAPARTAATSTAVFAPAPAVALPPALLSPALDARSAGVMQFAWLPTSALPAGAFYEVVVWSPEQDPDQAWGVAPPVLNQSLWLNLDDLFRSGRFREGNLYWTVLVVELDPYRRLTSPAGSERRYLVYASD